MLIPRLFGLFALMFVSTHAHAGCVNYEEQGLTAMPVVKICYDDKCDIARVQFKCANVSEVLMGYDIGWHVTYSSASDGKVSKTLRWKDRIMSVQEIARLTCQPIHLADQEHCQPFNEGAN